MADGRQISSPLESIKQGSGERVGINLGSKKSWASFNIVKSPLESISENALFQRRETEIMQVMACVLLERKRPSFQKGVLPHPLCRPTPCPYLNGIILTFHARMTHNLGGEF